MPDIQSQDVVSSYRRYAPFYDTMFGAVLGPGRRKLTETVTALAPRRLLEVGVGTGLALPEYPADTDVTGIDLSSDMLAIARKRADALPGRRIRLMEMDAEDLQFDDDNFDCVAVPYVLSVTPNPDVFVAELRRVCTPGGHIVLVNHFSGSHIWLTLEKLVSPLAGRIGFRSEFSYEENILRHPWTVLECTTVNLFGLSKLLVIRNEKPAR
ncbi:methyltransferase domain-containing protein [Luteimonas sp BLCC-B24]|uniref:class I SAM-dependent methyltransferase n=1 Tax=Luteimonas sp. BLCC-B24 TaxID=3025317 RepID=UPI00234D0679|nr:methyltransferase domain-containing protein [Luteimonas sp. BLCC-B24]MDC7807766.1 methyltransferase domain-containing protein [Luteimonas sp. BLCC-B24]